MLYLFCGSDQEKVLAKSQGLLAKLLDKKPETSVYAFSTENFDVELISNLLQADSLFEAKYILTWANLISNDKKSESREAEVKELMTVAQSAPHIVLWREGELTAKQKTTFSKYAEKVEEFEAKSKAGEIKLDFFTLGDYLGNRQKQEAWVYFQSLLQAGVAPEEILGPLTYFAKTLALVGQLQPNETGDLKPFIVGKYKRFLQKTDSVTALKKYEELLEKVAESRTISIPLANQLESWILGW